MTEPTTTRANIRRAIGRMTRMEFFLRYGDGYIKPTGTPTTEIIASTDQLWQRDGFWDGDWLYDATAGEERLIQRFVASRHELQLEYPFSSAADTDSLLEIWSMFPPSLVHQNINVAHRGSWRFFPNIVACETQVIQEARLRYPIAASDLNGPDTGDDYPGVAEVLQIWIERSRNRTTGQITSTSATANAANDTQCTPDTLASSNYLVSFYAGTGAGQLREMVSWDSDGLFTWDTEVVTEPDTTTKYAIWNPTAGEQYDDWFKLTAVHFDAMEFPGEFILRQLSPAAYGLRFKIVYSAMTTDFDTDSDVTTVPLEYLMYKALSLCHAGMVGDNRVDRASEAGLASYYDELSQKVIADDNRTIPGMTHWVERAGEGYSAWSDQPNPLNW